MIPATGARVAILWAAIAATASACDVGRTDFAPPVVEGMRRVDGASLYYKSIGTGEPIVVVHGGPGLEHSYLLPGLEPLGETYRLVLYDQRGLGRSTGEADSATISMDRYLDDLDAMREVAGVERMNVLAHSWGAYLATLYALERPERVRSLILVSAVEPGGRYRETLLANQRERQAAEDASAIDSITATPAFREGDAEAVRRWFRHVFRGTFADPADAQALRLDLTDRTARQWRQVAGLVMGSVDSFDLWDRLGSIEAPVLLVHGARDPIPLDMVREMSERLPHAQLVVLEDVGHFPFIEDPDGLFGAIQRFLESLDRGSPAGDSSAGDGESTAGERSAGDR